MVKVKSRPHPRPLSAFLCVLEALSPDNNTSQPPNKASQLHFDAFQPPNKACQVKIEAYRLSAEAFSLSTEAFRFNSDAY